MNVTRATLFVFLLTVTLTAAASAKIYRYVDENGTIHFTDKPYTPKAKEVDIKETGIDVHKTGSDKKDAQTPTPAAQKPALKPKKKTQQKNTPKKISEADYRISATAGKLGSDMMKISGRISSGPRCENMTVTATATSDTDLKATITTHTKKVTSHGSATFSGTATVSGSADDRGFWEVTDVKVNCND